MRVGEGEKAAVPETGYLHYLQCYHCRDMEIATESSQSVAGEVKEPGNQGDYRVPRVSVMHRVGHHWKAERRHMQE